MKVLGSRLAGCGAITRERTISLLLVAVIALMLAAACASPWANESAELEAQDSPIALRVKSALIEEPKLAGAAIDVAVTDGQARLTGFVETREQRDLAEEVAQRQQGVRSVVNAIEVK